MAANAGVRDGEFVKFPGWDLPGEDQAHLPDLQGKVSELKKVALTKNGGLFLAFNTNGWFKSWAVLDFSKFVRSNSDLYVRVEYPGWFFAQGKDSPGNDIQQIKDVSTSTGLREAVIAQSGGDNTVAAFNTNGWIKTKINYPLKDGPQNQSSLAGIYIRTNFLGFSFYPLKDSPGGDIKRTPEIADNVPELVRQTIKLSNSGGFNTNGWHKEKLQEPPPQGTSNILTQPYQGIYYRVSWPDFIYLPGLDSPYNDISNVGAKQLHELLDAARKDPKAIAANTDGWLKNKLVDEPQDFPGADRLKGVYVKYIDPDTWSAAEGVTPRADWIFNDVQVREAYRQSVSTATNNILARMNSGEITAAAAAEEAHGMRNTLLIGMRKDTSPPGLLIARGIKPAGGQYEYYLDRNAQSRYGKAFRELTEAEAKEVAIDTIKSAGRANPKVTEVLRKAGNISKGVLVIAVAVSVYSVATAPQWEKELGRQVFSWSGAIIAGKLGVGVGSLVGPVGAIAGGIIGSILGGIGADLLATWFFGGASSMAGEELLHPVPGAAEEIVEDILSKSGKGNHVHVIRAGLWATYVSEDKGNRETLGEIIKDSPEEASLLTEDIDSTYQILATIVWIRIDGRAVPANARNPGDLIKLMDYVRRNLPS